MADSIHIQIVIPDSIPESIGMQTANTQVPTFYLYLSPGGSSWCRQRYVRWSPVRDLVRQLSVGVRYRPSEDRYRQDDRPAGPWDPGPLPAGGPGVQSRNSTQVQHGDGQDTGGGCERQRTVLSHVQPALYTWRFLHSVFISLVSEFSNVLFYFFLGLIVLFG